MKFFKSNFLSLKLASYACVYQVPVRFKHFKLLNNKFDDYLNQLLCEARSEKSYLDMIPNLDNIILRTTKNNSKDVSYEDISRTVLTSYNIIEKSENITEESIHQAFVLAWAAKMTDSYCKLLKNTQNIYKKDAKFFEVSDHVVKDSDLLRSFMYVMIEHKFQDTKWYQDILQLYNKAFIYNRIGLYLEHSSRKQTNKYANINMTRYEKLCDFKVSYPYFQLPIFLAMTLANKNNTELQRNVARICFDMGTLSQIKKDFENCFGMDTIAATGGTDIQNGKCTWLAVTALQRFTPRQRLVFEACYGSDEPAHLERVKLLYDQLQLPRLYREKEGALIESIMQQAIGLEKDGIPSKLFEMLLEAMRTQ